MVGEIGPGLVVFVGVTHNDTPDNACWIAEKIASLRIFPDTDGKMNLDVSEIKGGVLVISQFTLFGDCKKGRRPLHRRREAGNRRAAVRGGCERLSRPVFQLRQASSVQ